jgi:hypothetical protein
VVDEVGGVVWDVVTGVVEVVTGTVLVDELLIVVEVNVPGVEADWQSKPMLWMPISQPFSPPVGGIWKVTSLAPPHCSFFTTEPPAEQNAVCLQVEPSGMLKRKSRSVSKETDTCISVMEKSLSPPEILGAFPPFLETEP